MSTLPISLALEHRTRFFCFVYLTQVFSCFLQSPNELQEGQQMSFQNCQAGPFRPCQSFKPLVI